MARMRKSTGVGVCARDDAASVIMIANARMERRRGLMDTDTGRQLDVSASLRAQRSNPSHSTKKEWIASSLSLLAMTAAIGATLAYPFFRAKNALNAATA